MSCRQMHAAGVRGVRFNFVKRLVDFTPKDELIEIAGRIAKLGWHVVIYFEAVDLPELWDFFTSLPTTVVVDHMGRPDVTKPVDGPEFELFVKFMREHSNVWSKVSLPGAAVGLGPAGAERRAQCLPRRDAVRPARRRDLPRSRAVGHRLAASQSEEPHAGRRPAGRFHSAHRDHAGAAAQAAGRQSRCDCTGPDDQETTHVTRKALPRRSRHDDLRRRAVAQGLSSEPVLHVADEGGESRALQGRRARLSRRVADDRGPEAGGDGARPQPLHRARRQHLLPRQDRRDRRQELPADGRHHDRHDRGGVPQHDAQRRPLDRRQPLRRRGEEPAAKRAAGRCRQAEQGA